MSAPPVAHPVVHQTLSVSREFTVPPEKLFLAFSDEEKKRRWYANGDGVVVRGYSLDFKVGGSETCEYQFGDDAPPMTLVTAYFDIIENRRIVYAFHMTLGGEGLTSSLATIEITPTASGCVMQLTEAIAYLNGAPHHENRIEGTRAMLERIAAEVEGA